MRYSKTPTASAPLKVRKVLAAVFLVFPIWLIGGGVLPLGPFIMHNIENKVGMFPAYCALWAWLPLLV